MKIESQPWTSPTPPRRVLAIRLQAMGDVVISLPYLQKVREQLPEEATFDFLVRAESASLPKNLDLFDKVFVIGGGRRFKLQLALAIALLPRLLLRRYDLILDVQNSEISRLTRRFLRPKAWSEFDKKSTRPAGERTRLTIEAAGLPFNPPSTKLVHKSDLDTTALLRRNGWNDEPLVLLNPGGAFPSRHWPTEYYIEFARKFKRRYPDTRFLLLGIARMAPQAASIAVAVDGTINLVGQTTPAQAFVLMQKIRLTLSEDSGLMHMSWVSGVPTIALFGASRSDWAQPLGPKATYLDGRPFDCYPCMQENCRFGDNRCLTQHTPEKVMAMAERLIG